MKTPRARAAIFRNSVRARGSSRQAGRWLATARLLLLPLAHLAGFVACGVDPGAAGGAAPEPAVASEEDFPVDPEAVRYHPIHHAAFGPWYGSGCPTNGACGCGSARDLAEEFNCQLDRLQAQDIPISAYLFDGSAWSRGSSDAVNTCVGPNCCAWRLGDQVVQRLARDGVRGLLHFWGGCHDEPQFRRASDRLGRNLLGFYLDDGSSDEDLQRVSEFMQAVVPGDWECVAKAFQNREPSTSSEGLRRWSNAAYMGDLGYDFEGLKEAVRRLLERAPYLPAPFAELTGYAYLDPGVPEEPVYYRRLHFGAMQPVMAHTPFANSDPWRPEYGPGLVPAYRYWAWLHRELVPYFYSYAYRMHENPSRAAVTRGPMSDSLRVGREIYAPIVTEPVEEMDIRLPPGQWLDYWNEASLVSGMLRGYSVPLGREPIFIRLGSLIPLEVERPYTGHGTVESRGSLSVLVYPDGASSFRYRQDARTPWITFSANLAGSALTLGASPGLPEQPVLYRIGRWASEPDAVGRDGATVLVNQSGSVPRLGSEAEVNGSASDAWFYDAAARRLIVKVVP